MAFDELGALAGEAVGAAVGPGFELAQLGDGMAAEAVREVGPGRWVPRTVSVAGEQWDHSSSDVSIAGLGWVAVGVKGQAELRVWVGPGVAVSVREAMVFDLARTFERPGFSVALPKPPSAKGAGDGQRAPNEPKEPTR